MDLFDLEVSLGEVLRNEVNLAEMLVPLVDREDWDAITRRFGPEFTERLKKDVQSHGKEDLVGLLRQIAKDEAEKLSREIKQALKDATSFQFRGGLGDILVQFQRRAELQNRKSDLLAVAFADRLTDLIFPAADRAAKLSELIVRERPTGEAEKYLEEACLCYFYELYSASAVMCRSILEEVIEKQFRQFGIDPSKELGEKGITLGALLGLAKRPDLRSIGVIPPEAWREVHTVNDLANTAVHQRPILEQEACDCLAAARHALGCILE